MSFDLEDIKKLLNEDKIQWSGHILEQMQKRNIKVKDVIESINFGEIIEFYPTDSPYPSCLIFGKCINGDILHVVCSLGEEKIWMITSYYPNNIEWLEDFKTRRR